MPPGRIAAGRRRAVRVIVALTAVSTCLGAVAYAATRSERPAPALAESKPTSIPSPSKDGSPPGKGTEALPRARFIEYPEGDAVAAEAQFRFHVPPRSKRLDSGTVPGPPGGAGPARQFQCRFDDGKWTVCSSPHRLTGLALGAHSLMVRALDRAGHPGPAISHSWRQVAPPAKEQGLDPAPFSIELHGGLEDLYPGHPPQQVPLVVSNPNPGAIEVTSLTVAIAADPPNCSAENFELTQSSVSPAAPLIVPAGASVELPTATVAAPTIGMLNLPVNQDPCRGVEVPLAFSGEARG